MKQPGEFLMQEVSTKRNVEEQLEDGIVENQDVPFTNNALANPKWAEKTKKVLIEELEPSNIDNKLLEDVDLCF